MGRGGGEVRLSCWASVEAAGVLRSILQRNRFLGHKPTSLAGLMKEALQEWCDARGLSASRRRYRIESIQPKNLPDQALRRFLVEKMAQKVDSGERVE